jgi:hypothetical protein
MHSSSERYKFAQGRLLRILDVAAGFDLALRPPGYQHRQIVMPMLVGVGQSSAVDNRMIQ